MTQVVPPILSVTPSRALVDEKFKVLVENLPPGYPVTVRSLHNSEDKHDWEAYGHYVSDHSGVVSGGLLCFPFFFKLTNTKKNKTQVPEKNNKVNH